MRRLCRTQPDQGSCTLQVQNNELDSELPENWPLELPKLSNLTMDGNKFQGSVPASWTNWGSLQSVCAPAGLTN